MLLLFLNIIFSPEFLTERTAKLDMLTQARIIFGGNKKLTQKNPNNKIEPNKYIKKMYKKKRNRTPCFNQLKSWIVLAPLLFVGVS